MEDELLKHQDSFYILATSTRADDRTRVLKHGETFAVFDRFGDVQPVGLGEQGLYHDGTRFLSRLEVRIGGRRPLLLSSTVKEENDLLAVDLTNPDIAARDGALILRRGELHLFRAKFLWRGACHERLRLSNFGLEPTAIDLSVSFDADFADVFEVRGAKRERRGHTLPPSIEGGTVVLAYRGLDEVVRRARLTFDPPPADLSGARARFELTLPPRETVTLLLTIGCEVGDSGATHTLAIGTDDSFAELQAELHRTQAQQCLIRSPNTQLSVWMNRSLADLQMMITETPAGPYPYAGVPWFSAPFGRDGIITALELLWLEPELARGVLGYLAATQATTTNPAQDAQPGKILHEARGGEMAALGEVPFLRYYGSVDATPLFVMLAGAYLRRTGDRAMAERLWPNVEQAMRWIDGDGDPDGDGFIEYQRMTDKGLAQQGWKDSTDSVFHRDGSAAEGPIALCEVQGYVYAARRAAAYLATELGKTGVAVEQRARAERLREAFERQVWSEELGTYVLALDGRKRPCAVRTSNAGHALYTGIASVERGAPDGGDADGRAELLGLGHPHRRRIRGALQPDVVSQRLGLAARQCHHRRRLRALPPARSGAPRVRGDVRRQPVRRAAPPAGAVLWFPAPARRGAHALSDRLRPAGVGRGRAVPDAAGLLGAGDRWRTQGGRLPAPGDAGGAAVAADHQPGGRRRLGRSAAGESPARRRRHRAAPARPGQRDRREVTAWRRRKAWGKSAPKRSSRAAPVGPASRIGTSSPANSARTWRQAPQGVAGGRRRRVTIATARIDFAPAATAAATALRSAQTVRP